MVDPPQPDRLFTTRQLAHALDVSEASIKRWCDKGLIDNVRTRGGHRRLKLSAILDFLRHSGVELLRPEELGLPANLRREQLTLDQARLAAIEALESGDEAAFRRLAFGLHYGGRRLAEICDQIIAPAFHQIGLDWQHHDLEIYRERRAVEICARWLHEMRRALPAPPPGAPRAIGGAVEGDLYLLPTTMVDLVLRESGWEAESFGVSLPYSTMVIALGDLRPQVCWLSVSHVGNERGLVAGLRRVRAAAEEAGTRLFAIGGRAITQSLRDQLPGPVWCDTIGDLVALLEPPASETPPHL